jgi:crotonobetainyl-CoA:carnitine CoA-transferase CaiB-like acyl-CoA transferase
MPKSPAPACGADTVAVLNEIGYSPEHIASLRAAGTI